MTTGTVKFFNESKGYGFIQPDDGDKDAFVHISAVERAGFQTLRENQRVAYDLEEGRNGKVSATNLRSIEEANANSDADAEPTDSGQPTE